MLMVFIIAGALAAGVAAALALPLLDGRRGAAAAVAILVPALSLSLYLTLGKPEVLGQPLSKAGAVEAATRNLRLLGKQPFETLMTEDPSDIWALKTLAEISLKLQRRPEAIQFYLRAIEFAEIKHDPHVVPLLETLLEIQMQGRTGRPSRGAMRTVDHLKRVQPDNGLANRYLREYPE